MNRSNPIDTINQRTIRSKPAIRKYTRNDEIWPAEQVIYDRIRNDVRDRPILDLGVGGGRTVSPLLELSADYVGVDYVPEMVDVCQHRYPDVRFKCGDARELSDFADGSFALVVFSCCGLGMVSHDDRLRALSEIRRVLVPGGYFAFSIHNRDSPECSAGFRFPEFESTRDPLRFAVRALRFSRQTVVSWRNYMRYRHHEIRTKEYAIINDRCHDHGTMLYYITLEQQRAQLERTGFAPGALAYDLTGHLVTQSSLDNAICLLAQRTIQGSPNQVVGG